MTEVPGGPGTPSAPGRPGLPGGPCEKRKREMASRSAGKCICRDQKSLRIGCAKVSLRRPSKLLTLSPGSPTEPEGPEEPGGPVGP